MYAQAALAFEETRIEMPKTLDGRGPEVVRHPTGGYTHAVPVPDTTRRVYEGWWKLKRVADAAMTHRYPQLASQAKPSAARAKSTPIPLPR